MRNLSPMHYPAGNGDPLRRATWRGAGGEIDDPLEERDGFGENALLTLIELVRQAFG